MYDELMGGGHLRGEGVWERYGSQITGVLEVAGTTGKESMGQSILE